MISNKPYSSSLGRCIQNQQNDSGALCINITQATLCNKLFIGQSSSYTHSICQDLKSTCTNNSNSGCQDKTCLNTNTLFTTHAQCNEWLSKCTINLTNNGCVEMKQTCLEQNVNSCLQAQEGQCIVYDNKCMKFTCQKLSDTLTTHNECESQNNQCTVATIGGCIMKSNNCNMYKTLLQCQYNIEGKKCWWNQYNMTCVNLQCDLIEQTNDYNTHNKCYNASTIIKCTLSSNGIGCQQLKQCTEYLIQGQCVIDKYNKQCNWNVNGNPGIVKVIIKFHFEYHYVYFYNYYIIINFCNSQLIVIIMCSLKKIIFNKIYNQFYQGVFILYKIFKILKILIFLREVLISVAGLIRAYGPRNFKKRKFFFQSQMKIFKKIKEID